MTIFLPNYFEFGSVDSEIIKGSIAATSQDPRRPHFFTDQVRFSYFCRSEQSCGFW